MALNSTPGPNVSRFYGFMELPEIQSSSKNTQRNQNTFTTKGNAVAWTVSDF